MLDLLSERVQLLSLMRRLDNLYRAHRDFAPTNINDTWPFFLLGWFLEPVNVGKSNIIAEKLFVDGSEL
jgi:hypothetical protein